MVAVVVIVKFKPRQYFGTQHGKLDQAYQTHPLFVAVVVIVRFKPGQLPGTQYRAQDQAYHARPWFVTIRVIEGYKSLNALRLDLGHRITHFADLWFPRRSRESRKKETMQ